MYVCSDDPNEVGILQMLLITLVLLTSVFLTSVIVNDVGDVGFVNDVG